jgi:hypothetical protein
MTLQPGDDYETPKLRGKAITSSDGGEPEAFTRGPGQDWRASGKIVQISSCIGDNFML